MDKICMQFTIKGRVQGVFFRANTAEIARSLDITGWVSNLPNGDVEVVACGYPNQIRQLEAWLWQGPPAAYVTDVISRAIPFEEYSTFRTR